MGKRKKQQNRGKNGRFVASIYRASFDENAETENPNGNPPAPDSNEQSDLIDEAINKINEETGVKAKTKKIPTWIKVVGLGVVIYIVYKMFSNGKSTKISITA
jgi:hypothetical protein